MFLGPGLRASCNQSTCSAAAATARFAAPLLSALTRAFSTTPALHKKKPAAAAPSTKKGSAGSSGDEPEEKLLLGRPSNNLKLGVVGMPNVGKSCVYNCITGSNVLTANYPFATIDPSEARVAVPDARFDHLVAMYSPKSAIPAKLTVTDIAGLVRGAASGAGLGNAFLAHIRAVDGIYHVVRCFQDSDIVHVENSVGAARDMEIIHDELRLKDDEFLANLAADLKKKLTRAAQGPEGKTRREELDVVLKALDWVGEQNRDIRHGSWTNREIEILNPMHLLTAKPVVYLANVSEDEYAEVCDSGLEPAIKASPMMSEMKAWIDTNSPGDMIIPFSGILEERLADASAEERAAVLADLGPKAVSALPQIITSGYQALSLVNYFTAGPGEVRAWTVCKGSKAPQAAGVIHTDFEKGFIAAEVMTYADLADLGSETAVRAAGKYATRGRDYVVQSGDVCFFKFNVTKGNKK
ncbi:hypothetical protein H9P43_000476 [Blastocladiella emersonii ATCC 22665]|nr:hypothetical protein H9P43_000476 [Blastocladiella emersonii ATCC 22665]